VFVPWLLRYSSFFITGIVSLIVGYVLHRLTTNRSDLMSYNSHVQWVSLAPAEEGQPPIGPVGTFTLFLWNPGKAPAREVHVGHYFIPANNVWPDIPREIAQTPGGGRAIRFPLVPPKTLISISYLFFGVHNVDQIISYVGWEQGSAKRIPVMLQRIWPKWYTSVLIAVFLVGVWTLLNITLSLIEYLWRAYYVR
jgi:hypothetical protein